MAKRTTATRAPVALHPRITSETALLMPEAHCRALSARLFAGAPADARQACDGASTTDAAPIYDRAGSIAIIRLNGVLARQADWIDETYYGMCSTSARVTAIAAALEDQTVSQIVLDIDSPGGFVNGTVELAEAVAGANKVKPVIAVVRGLCCSGAYWVASQAGQIFARPESEVGNIGVYSVLMDTSAAWDSMGVKFILVASGQFKGLGADGHVTDDLVTDTRRIILGLYQQFLSAIQTGRKLDPEQASELADGRSFLGPQAKKLGLVDGLAGDWNQTLNSLQENSMPQTNALASAAAATVAAMPGATLAAKPAAGSNEAARKALSTAIDTATAHRDATRSALDARSSMTDDMDDQTKSLATQCVSAAQAANDEASRMMDAWKADADDGDGDAGDGDGDEESKAAKAAKVPHSDFVACFGDTGARWFLEKKSFPAATKEYIDGLKATHAAELKTLKEANAELQTRIGAVDRGNEPASFRAVSTNPNEKTAAELTKLESVTGSKGMAAFVGGIKLPGQK